MAQYMYIIYRVQMSIVVHLPELYPVVPLALIAPIREPCSAEVECAGLKEKVEAREGIWRLCVHVYI